MNARRISVGHSHPVVFSRQQLRLPCVRRCRPAKRVVLLRGKAKGSEGRPEHPVADWQQTPGAGQGADSYQAAHGQDLEVPPPPWARQNQEYYQGQYPYATPPPTLQPTAGGIPWVWIGVGIFVAWTYNKVTTFFFTGGGVQAKMMSWMMKQAMAQASKQQGGAGAPPPGFPDFSKMGAPPPGFPGAFPGSGFPGASPPGAPSSRSSPVYDTEAKSVEDSGSRASSAAGASRSGAGEAERVGARFQDLKGQEQQRKRRRESDRSSSKAAFVDVDEEEASSSNGKQLEQGAPQNGLPFEPMVMPPPGSGSSAAGDDPEDLQLDMLDQLLQDPQMQEMLYQHLPEPMRNKDTFDWMLKNENYRAQLKATLKQQGASLNPEVFKNVKNMNSEEVSKQLAEHGLTPADVLQKIMAEPQLAAAFSKPQVQQAIMDLQTNPMAIVKYQDDPDVMLVFDKMATMFPQMADVPPPSAQWKE